MKKNQRQYVKGAKPQWTRVQGEEIRAPQKKTSHIRQDGLGTLSPLLQFFTRGLLNGRRELREKNRILGTRSTDRTRKKNVIQPR